MKKESKTPVLVVGSKVRAYVREEGLNLSAATLDVLTQRVEALLIRGVESAKVNGRKTVLDRDIPALGLLTQGKDS